MKNSIAASVLILAATAGLSWHGQRRLALARETHAKLVEDATRLGLSTDTNDPSMDIRFSRGERVDRSADGRQTAIDLIAFAKEMEEREKNGETEDREQAMRKRTLEMMDRIAAMDATALKSFIAEIRATTEIKEEMKEGLIGFSIMSLASDHPQAALAIYTETADVLKNKDMKEQVIASALAEWAKRSPEAALDWVRKHGEANPDVVTESAKLGIINGTAIQNPQLAFKLIGELKLSDPGDAINQIINNARTSEERTTVLKGTLEYLDTITDEKKREQLRRSSVTKIVRDAANDGFEVASQWIESAKLTDLDLKHIGSGGLYLDSRQNADTGKWITWMGEKIPGEKPANGIRNMMQTWAEQDYKAAGLWLDQAPAGSTKDASIRAYAETVSRYEPEAAAQWAEILPPGKDKDVTIRRIYDNWPKKDDAGKEAAAAYAAKHGIKEK